MSVPGDFWARRKAAVRAEQEAEARAEAARKLAEEHAALEEKPDAVILEELGLPDPDTLEPGADIAAFMKSAVPERLRRRALRQLWRVNPAFAVIDDLVEYGEDYTDAATVVENLQTAYQVGKGMMRHVEEMARQAELEARGAEAAPADEDIPDEEAGDIAGAPEAVATEEPPAPEPVAALQQPAEPEPQPQPEPEFAALPRRRIRFAFEDSQT